jgi:hypothetical protein
MQALMAAAPGVVEFTWCMEEVERCSSGKTSGERWLVLAELSIAVVQKRLLTSEDHLNNGN